jgi:hypothetical protein
MTRRSISFHGGRGELALFAAAYLVYSLARWVGTGDPDVATANAHWIVHMEEATSLHVEGAVQGALASSPALWVLNHLYLAAQLVVVPATLAWLYRRSRRAYRRLRNTVLATWLVSVPVYVVFPVAPPRLAGIGIADTITTQTGFALDSGLTTSFYNPLAAVPSLHAGFAIAVSAALACALRGRPVAVALTLLWAPAVALSVVATGNHFFFDIAAGAVATGAGFALAEAASRTAGRFGGASPAPPLIPSPQETR